MGLPEQWPSGARLRMYDPSDSSPGSLGLEEFVCSRYVPAHLGMKSDSADQLMYAARLLERHHGGTLRVDQLSLEVVIAWLSAYAKTAAANTVNSKRAKILAIWRWAHLNGHASPPPDARRVPRMKVPKRKPQAWTIEQLSALLAVVRGLKGKVTQRKHASFAPVLLPRNLWWEALILLCYDTGLRVGAVLELQTTDIDLAQRRVIVRAETQKDAEDLFANLHPETVTALQRVWPAKPGPVLVWPHVPDHLFAQMRKFVTLAAIPSPKGNHLFHRVRRTSASYAAKGGGMGMAQDLMGHARERMTTVYVDTRISNADKPSAIDMLPRPTAKPKPHGKRAFEFLAGQRTMFKDVD